MVYIECLVVIFGFFFNDTATTEIYTLSLHDALPIFRHRHTCVPHPEPSSLLPPHTIPLGRPSALGPSIQYRASNLDWQLVSYMIFYMFQCHSPKSPHPLHSISGLISFHTFPRSLQSSHMCFFAYLEQSGLRPAPG